MQASIKACRSAQQQKVAKIGSAALQQMRHVIGITAAPTSHSLTIFGSAQGLLCFVCRLGSRKLNWRPRMGRYTPMVQVDEDYQDDRIRIHRHGLRRV